MMKHTSRLLDRTRAGKGYFELRLHTEAGRAEMRRLFAKSVARGECTKPAVARVKARKTNRARPVLKFAGTGTDPAVIDFVRGIKEPFTCKDVAKAPRMLAWRSKNTVCNWRVKGWIKTVEWGKYVRTKEFGN